MSVAARRQRSDRWRAAARLDRGDERSRISAFDRRSEEGTMRWRRGLAALFVILSLGGCTEAATGPGPVSHAPYSYEQRGTMHDGGGGEGGGGSSGM
jgi:hypothetical protein